MLHGWDGGHGHKKSIKKAKELLSKYRGDVYLISNELENLIKKLNSDRVFHIIKKPEILIGSFKAYKKKSDFSIKGEFHPYNGVHASNYDKLVAHFPWGPMSKLKFVKHKPIN